MRKYSWEYQSRFANEAMARESNDMAYSAVLIYSRKFFNDLSSVVWC